MKLSVVDTTTARPILAYGTAPFAAPLSIMKIASELLDLSLRVTAIILQRLARGY